MTAALTVPESVRAWAARGPAWAAYVDGLPRLARSLCAEWELTADGALQHGHASLVVPVRRAGGEPAMLKLAFPDEEGEHEALGLQTWAGRGAVRLLAADPGRSALLLERLHARDLRTVGALEACEIVAGLYDRLHVPAPARLRPLSAYVARSSERLARWSRDAPVPHRLVRQAVGLARALVEDPATDGTLVHGDLHDANVLAADREPWLVIDPKPMSGDPHYELAPMLWNRWEEISTAHDARVALRLRFRTLLDVAGLDEDRARDWVVVRMLHNALWEVETAERERRAPDAAWLTRCVTVAKAVQE